MPRGERYNPYQLPFDFGTQPLDMNQHVQVLKGLYALHPPADAAEYSPSHKSFYDKTNHAKMSKGVKGLPIDGPLMHF